MIDRINTFVGELYLRAGSLSLKRQEGQTMAEYALILGVIAIVTVATVTALGGAIHTKLQSICTTLGGVNC